MSRPSVRRRTASGRPDSIVGAVRSEVRALDPALPIDDVVVLSDAVQAQIANPRLVALTLNGFATTASALAALGLGTLIAWQVRLRLARLVFAWHLARRHGRSSAS